MSLTNDTKRALEALALAHAADLLSQRENESRHPVPTSIAQHAPQVALLAEAMLSAHLLDYALETCSHLKAGLILIDPLPQQADRLTAWVQRIESFHIQFTVIPLPHTTMASLHDFTTEQPRLLFVILSDAAHHALGAKEMQWHCTTPLVVVSDHEQDHPSTRITLRS